MRKKSALIALAILALGLIGTGVSIIYVQNEFIGVHVGDPSVGTWKFSYGFPLSWYGYSQAVVRVPTTTPKTYWFSLESFLLDAAFWIAISFFTCIATMKSVSMLHKTRTSKNLSVINKMRCN
jgi:hypothetical protein